eukprot:CAMPEP_0113307520 /NCGR_PEP_ID=MMETSP0010_2-20120614/6332_1 /TAXON_ID=216773 ORGANISM="Corethron hystrix, Strain 308" /NCGR_SAMPLE_ID=MMETSP0010_2 /ASSEMBLY_ACC=CAM_ASM_000155 /LENGTH=184 /DNA_ID=CAMNT_0000162391 /DNA_START=701 /DNA_END=1255 /DNA_ORIENTATION=- /assembly_acc=CAM_ASM_000155
MRLFVKLGYRHQTTLGPKCATSQPQLADTTETSEAKLAKVMIFRLQSAAQRNDKHDKKINSTTKAVPEIQIFKRDNHATKAKAPSHVENTETDFSDLKTEIRRLVEDRNFAREYKRWIEADVLRETLRKKYGVTLKDLKCGKTCWEVLKPKHQGKKKILLEGTVHSCLSSETNITCDSTSEVKI